MTIRDIRCSRVRLRPLAPRVAREDARHLGAVPLLKRAVQEERPVDGERARAEGRVKHRYVRNCYDAGH